jgi:Domain of unknown function (DUF4919)
MIKRAISIAVLLLAFAIVSAQENKTAPAQKTSYANLLERAKKSDPTLDFKELRFAYTETREYSPYGADRDNRGKMFAAINGKQFDVALEHAEKILAGNFLDLNGQFGAYVAHGELNHPDKSAFHKYMFVSLLKSIQDSGDGKTPATAFVVISTDEEYVLFKILGLRVTNQALLNQDGHSYDRMTATNPKTNETVVYFFNIDKPFNHLGNSLKD